MEQREVVCRSEHGSLQRWVSADHLAQEPRVGTVEILEEKLLLDLKSECLSVAT
jgi:hypothetical protein